MRRILYVVLALAILRPCETRAQQRDAVVANLFGVEPDPYSVGFQLIEEQDPSRAVTDEMGASHPRPMRIYLWYPATRAGQPIRFARYSALANEDSWPSTVAGGLREKLKFSNQPLARSLGPGAFAALLQRPVLAVENAKPANTRFPLVVIGEGIYFELRVPWLHSVPKFLATRPSGSTTESMFEAAAYSDRFLLVVDGIAHADFTSYALIEGRSAVPIYWAAATPADAERQRAVSRYVFNFLAAFLIQDNAARDFLSRAPNEAVSGPQMTLEHRSAKPASISYDEFVRKVVTGRADEAIRDLRTASAVEPNHLLLRETYLNRLVVSLT